MQNSSHSDRNRKSKVDTLYPQDTSSKDNKYINKRQSLISPGRGSTILKRPLHVGEPSDTRKSEYYQEFKEVFEWDQFKKNPQAVFFEDPGNMELITHDQLMEVEKIVFICLFTFFFSDS